METKPDFKPWDTRDHDILSAKRKAFWTAMRPWLATKGYVLYNYQPTPWDPEGAPLFEATSTPYTGVQELPYAFLENPGDKVILYDDDNALNSPRWCSQITCQHRFIHAQDLRGRHVIIKTVNGNTDEIKILQRLKDNVPLSSDPMEFPGVIPVLDILPYEENFFVVMPRWGDVPTWTTWFNHNYEILDLIRCALKGLAVLHNNRIFHLDLREENILVNYAWGGSELSDSELFQDLRTDQKLVYAINDFDLSHIFPLDTPLKESRLYAYAASSGVYEKPYGVLAGELDFNPFAYDVGCLGIFFCENYQHLINDLPFLAPLLDGMVTANIDKRLTAREALDFFEEERANVTNDQLQKAPLEPAEFHLRASWNCCDRWEPLTPATKAKWARYRMNKPSWLARQLQSLRSTGSHGAYTVYYLRLFGRYVERPHKLIADVESCLPNDSPGKALSLNIQR